MLTRIADSLVILASSLTLVALSAPLALAVDGVIEISQTRAIAGGTSSCDTPGFPVSLCEGGSYRLTSNLDFPSTAARGIEIRASDVSIDLNGMTIKGQSVCATGAGGWVTSCTPGGGGFAGIANADASFIRTTLLNGRIVGAGTTCLNLGDQASVRDVHVSHCAGWGVAGGAESTLVNVSAIRNLGFGVSVEHSGQLRGIVALRNTNDGVYAGEAASLIQITAHSNGGFGLQFASSGTANQVTTNTNHEAGISLQAGAHLSDFSAYGNGGAGIVLNGGSTAHAGSIRNNGANVPTSCGIQGSGGGAYHGVAITAFFGGNPATACGAVNLGANTCQGGACPP